MEERGFGKVSHHVVKLDIVPVQFYTAAVDPRTHCHGNHYVGQLA